ncbi:MAG: hypothetical protein ACI8RZ_003767, partial [Myxococcota bacterium]
DFIKEGIQIRLAVVDAVAQLEQRGARPLRSAVSEPGVADPQVGCSFVSGEEVCTAGDTHGVGSGE